MSEAHCSPRQAKPGAGFPWLSTSFGVAPSDEPIYSTRHPSPLAVAMTSNAHQAQGRALEYFCAIVMLSWAAVLALPGDTLAAGSLKPLLGLGIQETWVAMVYGAMGAARLVTLVINGRWPHGPWLRVAGASLGFLMWSQVVMVITWNGFQTGIATTGIAVYLPMALAELYSIYRASSDGRYTRSR